MSFKSNVRAATLNLMAAGVAKRTPWTPQQKRDFGRAFAALQRLSGHKIKGLKPWTPKP